MRRAMRLPSFHLLRAGTRMSIMHARSRTAKVIVPCSRQFHLSAFSTRAGLRNGACARRVMRDEAADADAVLQQSIASKLTLAFDTASLY